MRRSYCRRDGWFREADVRLGREIEEAWPKLTRPMKHVKRTQGVAVVLRPLCISRVGVVGTNP